MQEVVIKLTLEQVNILLQAISAGAMKVSMDFGLLGAAIQSQANAQVAALPQPPAGGQDVASTNVPPTK